MPSSPTNTAIPLQSLLTMLKAEGFDIGTSTLLDIQKILASLTPDELADFRELKSVLSPFICRNKEEQEHFNKVFDKYTRSIPVSVENEIINPPDDGRKKRARLRIAIAVLLLVAAGIYYFISSAQRAPAIELVVEANSVSAEAYALINDTVIYNVKLINIDSSKKHRVSIRIDDTIYHNITRLRKPYITPGDHEAEAWVLNEEMDTLARSTLQKVLVKCENTPSVAIRKQTNEQAKNSSRKTYIADITNPSRDSVNYSFNWFIDDQLVSTEKIFTTGHTSEKPYKVSLLIGPKGIHCSIDSLAASLTEFPAYDLAIIPAKPFTFNANTNWNGVIWVCALGLVLPVSFATFVLLFKRKRIRKLIEEEPEPDMPDEYTGPFKIEFKTQNDKITAEVEIGQMAEAMRKRHVSDIMHLNIRKTIGSTIRSGGFPSLMFTPRTEPTDFLVFLDKGNSIGHQSQLFEYILKRLQNEQVNIIAYHYHKEPLFLSNEKFNHSMIPVDKIERLYPNTVLIIFSNTEAFFQSLNRRVKPWVNEKFKVWQRKIIITPVPVNDWDYKESALLREGFTVVPADLNAHHLIIGEINDLINKEKMSKLSLPSSYSSRFVNFDEWSELKQYLGNDPQLLRWVCALAVYPYVDWKVTIAIGKAIENASPKTDRLVTYSNLLKISRIKWMQSGVQTDELRLNMLHHLDNNTEVIARNAMVELLKEVEDDFSPSSLARDEFELNKTVNRFLLHTQSPDDNALSELEKKLMKKYVKNQVLDYPLDNYLNSSERTLLKDKHGKKSISPEEFFEADDSAKQKKIKQELMIRRLIAAAAVITGLFFVIRYFSDQKNYKLESQFTNISVNFSFTGSALDASGTEVSFTSNGKLYPGEKISDSSFVIREIAIDSSQSAIISVQNNVGNLFIERPVELKWQAFNVSVIPPPPRQPLNIRYNEASVYSAMEMQLNNELYRYNISSAQQDFSDSSKIVYYEANQKMRADSIVETIRNILGINVRTEFIE